MRLEDKHILGIITDLGTASTGQILAEVSIRYPDQDRTPKRVMVMIYSLLKYGFIEYIERYGRRYYFLPGTEPRPIFDTPYIVKIRGFFNASPGEYTADQIASAIGTDNQYTARVLHNMPGLSRRRTGTGPYYYRLG